MIFAFKEYFLKSLYIFNLGKLMLKEAIKPPRLPDGFDFWN
jgi:hypothetical protein